MCQAYILHENRIAACGDDIVGLLKAAKPDGKVTQVPSFCKKVRSVRNSIKPYVNVQLRWAQYNLVYDVPRQGSMSGTGALSLRDCVQPSRPQKLIIHTCSLLPIALQSLRLVPYDLALSERLRTNL